MNKKITGRRILALTPWSIFPAKSGGTQRCLNLLSHVGDVTILSVDWKADQVFEKKYRNLRQIVLPISAEAKTLAKEAFEKYQLQSWDAIPWLINESLDGHKEFINRFSPELIFLEHPWFVKLTDGHKFIYDAHNCESKNSEMLFGQESNDLLFVNEIEKFTLENADHVFYCSEADLNCIDEIFPIRKKSTMIPNGADLHRKKKTKNVKQLLFIGTAYRPNITAAQNLIDKADELSDYEIVVVGGCGEYLKSNSENVKILGTVSNRRLFREIKKSFALVNLAESGSGTHLKIALAQSFGLPVVTTEIGSRGFKAPIVANRNLNQALEKLTLNYEEYSLSAYREAKNNTWDSHGVEIRKIATELLD